VFGLQPNRISTYKKRNNGFIGKLYRDFYTMNLCAYALKANKSNAGISKIGAFMVLGLNLKMSVVLCSYGSILTNNKFAEALFKFWIKRWR